MLKLFAVGRLLASSLSAQVPSKHIPIQPPVSLLIPRSQAHKTLLTMSDKKFCIEYAKRGTAGCKKCKEKIGKGLLRVAKLVSNPFSDSGGDMKQWYHSDCIFETFARARATTKIIEEPDDLDGWEDIQPDDRKKLLELIANVTENRQSKPSPSKKVNKQQQIGLGAGPSSKVGTTSTPSRDSNTPSSSGNTPSSSGKRKPAKDTSDPSHKDNSFRQFRQICANIADEPSYKSKSEIINVFITDGTGGDGFRGNLLLWTRLLLPGVIKRVYNLQSKQLAKLFSQIFDVSLEEMVEDLEQGDVAETVRVFFEQSNAVLPAKKSNLSIQDVDRYLDELSQLTKEEEQQNLLKKVAKRCTANDLKIFVRLIKADLRINAGAKHILDGIHPDAYEAFQTTRDLEDVLQRVQKQRAAGKTGSLEIGISLMTPVLPMLAEPCKSVEYAMKKCPNGMLAEIKYDGERVQLHKRGDTFAYFSRSLKPVLPHKVKQFKEFIPQAFPHGENIILDAEVLLIDTNTGKPLPFGTLGVHKKSAFKDANVCLFVFDCLHLNGENLMKKTIMERRKILEKYMTEIPNRIMFSELKHITKAPDLSDMIASVIRQGLEGLVLKDFRSIYEPGKRHWLKVKKDYLGDGQAADSADLVVLGAWFGTGNKGGMMSVFLMGCFDGRRWRTVTKVHGGHDDATLDRLQTELKVVKISKDPSKVPKWLECSKTMIPDFVVQDPQSSQVWEVTGAEFTKNNVHTAHGISIRFPRVTKIRDDKDWETATSLQELLVLYENSKAGVRGRVFVFGALLRPLVAKQAVLGTIVAVSTAGRQQRGGLADQTAGHQDKAVTE